MGRNRVQITVEPTVEVAPEPEHLSENEEEVEEEAEQEEEQVLLILYRSNLSVFLMFYVTASNIRHQTHSTAIRRVLARANAKQTIQARQGQAQHVRRPHG